MEPNFVLCDLALEVFQIPEPSPAPAFGSGINNSTLEGSVNLTINFVNALITLVFSFYYINVSVVMNEYG